MASLGIALQSAAAPLMPLLFAGELDGSSSSSTGSAVLPPSHKPADVNGHDHIWLYFLSLMIVILVHRWVGALFNKVGIPRIIGDIVAGCLLGPTIMGTDANLWLFPRDNRPIITMFGQLGLILTSMSAGFAFDRRVMAGKVGKICAYTMLNLGVPALVSVPLFFALPDNSNWRGSHFETGAFFMLICCALGSSALPMVFLILDELKVNNDTSRFAIGLSCLSTVGLFTMLSVVVVLSDESMSNAWIILRLLFLALVVVALAGLQFVWQHYLAAAKKGQLLYLRYGSDDMALLVIALGLISAVASERLGYTFLLGAFLAGAAMPFDIGLRSNLGEKIRWLTRWVFLPQFFLSAGLQFDLRTLKAQSVPYVILFLFLAFAAKALLIPITRFVLRQSWRDAAFCASLANCRGFNALIIAQVGSQYGLIGPSFVITCTLLSIFSTAATGPLAKRFKPADGHAHGTGMTPRGGAHLRSPGSGRPASPRLLDGDENKDREDSSAGGSGGGGGGGGGHGADQVHIVLPSDSEGSGGVSAALGASVVDGGHLSVGGENEAQEEEEEDREVLFSSWLSESYSSNKHTALIVFGEELRERLRHPSAHSQLAMDSSSGEHCFRGDLLCDALCAWYHIRTRSVAVQLGQKMLECGIIAPVQSPVFLDKRTAIYSLG